MQYGHCDVFFLFCRFGIFSVCAIGVMLLQIYFWFFILENRVMLCPESQDGRTALMFAAKGGFMICARALVEAGANKEATNKVRVAISRDWQFSTHA
jgi:hypothetical protein